MPALAPLSPAINDAAPRAAPNGGPDDVRPRPIPRLQTLPRRCANPVREKRPHTQPRQIAQIAASIREFGFTNPILVDGERGVIAGHGRLLAARQLGMDTVPTIELAYLTAAQKRA